MNIPVHDDHTTLSFETPTSKEGQYICLKAEMDLVIAFSACPQVSLCLVGEQGMRGADLAIGYFED
jgi:uncharacterized protein YcgI (DUF1989 family)